MNQPVLYACSPVAGSCFTEEAQYRPWQESFKHGAATTHELNVILDISAGDGQPTSVLVVAPSHPRTPSQRCRRLND